MSAPLVGGIAKPRFNGSVNRQRTCVVLLATLTAPVACHDAGLERAKADPTASFADPAPFRAGSARLTLGGWSGEGQTDFHEIVGVIVDRSAGILVVANGGDATIRTFDLDGGWRSTRGGIGDGPREFRDLTSLFQYRGDSLAAFDEDADVASIWPYSGGKVRRVSAPPLPPDSLRDPRLRGALTDGRLVWSAQARDRQLDEVGASHPEPMVLFVTSAEGTDFVPIARTTGHRYFRYVAGTFQQGRAPFSPRSFVLARDSLVLFGSTEYARVERVSGSGVPLEPIVFSRSSIPVDGTHREWEIARRRAILDRPLPTSFREGQTAVLEILPFPDSFPALGDIVAGRDGRLWLTNYPPPETNAAQGEEKTAVWSVYAGSGSPGRDIEFRGRFRLYWADEREAAGVLRDELDIEHVAIVPLPSGAGGPNP